MCKRLRDIFFPTNLLGKNVRCVSFDTSGVEVVDGRKVFTILKDGGNVELSYTKFDRDTTTPPPHKTKYTSVKQKLTLARNVVRVPHSDPGAMGHTFGIANNVLYFKCTNVQSLTVNGTRLI